jgi:hypothetical protein
MVILVAMLVVTSHSPLLAQERDDIFNEPQNSRSLDGGGFGLTVNDLIEVSRELERPEPEGFEDKSIDEAVGRYRQSRQPLGPQILQQAPGDPAPNLPANPSPEAGDGAIAP